MKVLVVLSCLLALGLAMPSSDHNSEMEWYSYKRTYGKTYASPEVEGIRRNIYFQNKRKVEAHNAKYDQGLVSYFMKLNQHADQMSHEVAQQLNGYRMDLKKPSGIVFNMTNGYSPKSVDWRTKGAVTGVKNQGQCGSCWAFSTTGSLEGQTFLKKGKLVSLSEQQLVDCAGDYGNQGCGGGLMDSAFKYIKANGGIDSEKSYPYTGEDGDCEFNKKNVAATCTGFVDIPQGDESALQKAVATVGPISVAIDASQDSFQMYGGGVYDEPDCSSSQLDHGVLAVGYGTEKGQDYWLVKNSWGGDWGEEGYIKMKRNHRNQCGIASMASYPLV